MYFLDLPDLHFEFFGMRSAPASALSLSMHVPGVKSCHVDDVWKSQ